jgi:hypothetical protein
MTGRHPSRPSRFSFTALGAAVALFVTALGAFLVLGIPAHRTVGVFTSGHNRQQEHAIEQYLERHGAEACNAATQTVTPQSTYLASARASAVVSCDVGGSGPQTVLGLQFANSADLNAWERDNINYVQGTEAVGTCSERDGLTPWAGAGGSLAGTLYCEASSGVSALVWSNRRQLAGFYASSSHDGMSALLDWWEERIRGRPATEQSGLGTIRSLIAHVARSRLSDCTAVHRPLSDAGLECGKVVPVASPHDYLDSLTVLHFGSATTLNAFYSNYQRAFRAPSTEGAVYCDSGALVSSTYYLGSQLGGRIFCYPYNNSEYILWTNDRRRIAGLARRADENETALYRAWQAVAEQ